MKAKPKIVILGAGYGGIMTAKHLQKLMKQQEAEITLVNKHDYHYFTTHLHMPAAGTEHPEQTRVNIASILDPSKIRFLKSHAVKVIPERNVVVMKDGELVYDYLVIGLGAKSETFGIKGIKEHALTIQSINRVRFIYQHIRYQLAKYKASEGQDRACLTFVIGGAGFTGIEFIGEMAEQLPLLCKEFDIDPSLPTIINVQSSDKALSPSFDQMLVEHAIQTLQKKGVRFKFSTRINECASNGVYLSDGEFIAANTVVWTGGVKGNYFLNDSGFETVRGRVKVKPTLQAPDHNNIFIIGDCSIVENEKGEPFPPTAQIAIQQAGTCAANLIALLRGRPLKAFIPKIKGTVASLGKYEAVGMVGNYKLKGYLAVFLKRMIDIKYLAALGGIKLIMQKIIFIRNYKY